MLFTLSGHKAHVAIVLSLHVLSRITGHTPVCSQWQYANGTACTVLQAQVAELAGVPPGCIAQVGLQGGSQEWSAAYSSSRSSSSWQHYWCLCNAINRRQRV